MFVSKKKYEELLAQNEELKKQTKILEANLETAKKEVLRLRTAMTDQLPTIEDVFHCETMSVSHSESPRFIYCRNGLYSLSVYGRDSQPFNKPLNFVEYLKEIGATGDWVTKEQLLAYMLKNGYHKLLREPGDRGVL